MDVHTAEADLKLTVHLTAQQQFAQTLDYDVGFSTEIKRQLSN